MRPPCASTFIAGLLILCHVPLPAAQVAVDCARDAGAVRPLHGVNNGPLNFGEIIDLTSFYRQLHIPYARLHDSEWPAPDIVDIHAVFPDLTADPDLPQSYRFARTDTYIAAIVASGVQIVYRLGESIEHSRRKYNVNPPADYDAWAAACIGIIRHYNEGWADGFHYGIKHWEIWNEPENKPNMWTASDDDYYRLYEKTAHTIKTRFPDLYVGGPSIGAPGQFIADHFQPSPFLKGFLDHCKQNNVPLDFFSWHTYTNDPLIYPRKANAIRKLLDDYGFTDTRIHLNEWNYLPDNDWNPLSLAGQGLLRQRWFERIAGPEGAAFTAAVLCRLQDTPVDVANYYSGDTNLFGLFNRYGAPRKTFYAMKAFSMLLNTSARIEASEYPPGELAVCAGRNSDKTRISILVADLQSTEKTLQLEIKNLPAASTFNWQLLRLDENHNLQPTENGAVSQPHIQITTPMQAPSILLFQANTR